MYKSINIKFQPFVFVSLSKECMSKWRDYSTGRFIGLPLCMSFHNFSPFLPRFAESSFSFSALDVSNAGSPVHSVWLPQPLLQTPEKRQTLCQHDSEEHVYK